MKLEVLTEDEQKRLRTMTQAQWALIERLTDSLVAEIERRRSAEMVLDELPVLNAQWPNNPATICGSLCILREAYRTRYPKASGVNVEGDET